MGFDSAQFCHSLHGAQVEADDSGGWGRVQAHLAGRPAAQWLEFRLRGAGDAAQVDLDVAGRRGEDALVDALQDQVGLLVERGADLREAHDGALPRAEFVGGQRLEGDVRLHGAVELLTGPSPASAQLAELFAQLLLVQAAVDMHGSVLDHQ